jgi:hypothetical protein
MTSPTDLQLVTAAEAARLLGVTRQRVLEQAASAVDFPAAELTPTGGRTWPRAAVQAWAAAHPDLGPVFTGPDVPADHGRTRQVWAVLNLASSEAQALNHPWIGPDHLGLAMLHPDCPGAARAVLESFGARLERLRQAFVDSMGDPYDTPMTHRKVPPATQLALERANLEAAWLADAEVTSEHVLLALIGRWRDSCFVLGWLARCGIAADAVRQRLIDATEGVVLPEPPAQLEPPPAPSLPPSSWDTLQLAPSPLGHDPRRRHPWGSRGFGVPLDPPPKQGGWAGQYFIDRDGYPVLTVDGRPVHIVMDEDTDPVLDEHGREVLGPVEIPQGATLITGPDPS